MQMEFVREMSPESIERFGLGRVQPRFHMLSGLPGTERLSSILKVSDVGQTLV